tara:strand:- start:4673 stop:4813 length:141 start_codon:yes stop_codon:yes gene_type:complete
MDKKGFQGYLDKQRRLDALCGLILLATVFGGWFFSGMFVGCLLWNN